ncbi:MAG: beta-ketoacyl-ACP synthase III [Candidatus Eisenbacteria bacterium]|nr:beta-ketoacyl-ACP synthase III [Candidatus Eisenbacteria bacterium]
MAVHSRVYGTGMYVPDEVITNQDLARIVDTSDEWIVTRTGMRERRRAHGDQAASDLAIPAALAALDEAGITARDLDMIIVATVTPDTLFPSTACLMQERLGARSIPAFDVSAGCTGAIYAISLAHQLLSLGTYRHILVVGVEMLTRITNWSDRSTCVLFGDAAGAIVLGPSDDGVHGLLGFHLASDGGRGHTLHMPAGGSRMPATRDTVDRNLHTLHMRGNEIYKTAVTTMYDSCKILLDHEKLSPQDVDVYVFHQANLRIIEAVGKRLGVSSDKVFVNIHKYGNTSSASTLLAIHEARREGAIKPGSLVLQVAFGAGLTWGGILWRW